MKMREIKITLDGLYKWGDGWDTATKTKWESYWSNVDSSFWKVHVDDSFGGTHYLVSVFGGGMIHPMDGCHFIIRGIGSSFSLRGGSMEEVVPEIDDLIELFEKCAKECGGIAKVEINRTIEV